MTSTTKNLVVALEFSKCLTIYPTDKLPVLFIFSIRNYYGLGGVRLDNKRFSMYPQEEEYLLQE